MRIATFVLVLAHLGIGGLWLGAMAYSLAVVQPRLGRMFGGPAGVEDAYRELAAGNRWRVVGMLAVLGGSGAALVLLAGPRPLGWWLLITLKTLLYAGAAALFWWVSWRGWPRRVFALPDELPALQQRFRRVAIALAACVGTAFVLGVAAIRLAG